MPCFAQFVNRNAGRLAGDSDEPLFSKSNGGRLISSAFRHWRGGPKQGDRKPLAGTKIRCRLSRGRTLTGQSPGATSPRVLDGGRGHDVARPQWPLDEVNPVSAQHPEKTPL
ncbi:hypothetical protein NL676_031638 [Syzygium grande]|nr:hypothetical protein NL676_031638 [Syzygium grande]